MADFSYVPCPGCTQQFMVGEEFFRIPEAYCHCPFCGREFRVYSGPTEAGRVNAAGTATAGKKPPT